MALRKQLLNSLLEKKASPDFWTNLAVFIFLGIAYWPITQWFAATTHDQSRLFHALMVLTLATAALVKFGGVEIKEPLSLNESARRALVLCISLIGLQYVARAIAPDAWQGAVSLIAIPAYCCGLAAFVRFIFGPGVEQLTRAAAGTLCTFLSLSILMQPLDWPLRAFAGKCSASALAFIGKQVELGLFAHEGVPPKLILLVNQQHPFHVASECNGFGVILTSLLIALLLSLHRGTGIMSTALRLLAGLAIGFAFNVLRIVIIVLMAPSFPEHYMLMHEIVGGITYWGCLILVWIALQGPTREGPTRRT
ncbi:MAG: archaeosortase/exosortase family protein [Opitutales bacterium]